MNMFGDNGMNPNGQNNMPLFGQQQKDSRSGIYNMANDILGLNMWRNNLNNYNVFGQAPQQDLLGLYNQTNNMNGMSSMNNMNNININNMNNMGNMNNMSNMNNMNSMNNMQQQQNNYNIAQAGLGMAEQYKAASSQPQDLNQDTENKLLKLTETKFDPPEIDGKTYTLTERPIQQLNVNESNQNNLYYAVVDLSGGQMYLMEQINKDNFPPPFVAQAKSKNTIQGPTSLNNLNNSMDIIGNSPALHHGSWTSPPLNTATLMNYPLFNNPLMAFGKNFSPNLNLFQESPRFDRNLFSSTPKMEGSDWTPETLNRPLFSGLGMKQRLGLANSRGDTPPDVKIGTNNGAFLRRINEKIKPPSGPPTDGAMKFSSPSSFLQSSQTNYSNRNKV